MSKPQCWEGCLAIVKQCDAQPYLSGRLVTCVRRASNTDEFKLDDVDPGMVLWVIDPVGDEPFRVVLGDLPCACGKIHTSRLRGIQWPDHLLTPLLPPPGALTPEPVGISLKVHTHA